ncbi:cell division ATP-binding protein FtsE [Paratractidigestivibacter sp.]|uniref:cell division ATP-binding protein FtsE n=1 Tax=Paratractidigestivibacter sp. TaxID=2847316 RepID=UPI002ABDA417|nr:cell division ATP-binding protein FtsE [Paratractidigestivibacter sp.]
MANHSSNTERQVSDAEETVSEATPAAATVATQVIDDDVVDAILYPELISATLDAPAVYTSDPAAAMTFDDDFTVYAATASEPANPADPTDQPGFTSVFAPLVDDDAPAVSRTGKPTVSFKNVSLIYPAQPNKPALDGVSLDVYPGEFVFVVGHSGSGKSSLLRLITRELKATHGRVVVGGQDLTKMRNKKVPYLRRQIGTVYQDFKLLPNKTVYENVAFALECIGKPRSVIDAQVPEVLRLVGLAERMGHFPDQLSGGEQQRVSVARAMVNRPPLLICDEPTGNLDPAISRGIMKLLDRINRAGTTIIMATHDREMVDSMRKRVIALEAGHIVRDQEKGGYGYYGAL